MPFLHERLDNGLDVIAETTPGACGCPFCSDPLSFAPGSWMPNQNWFRPWYPWSVSNRSSSLNADTR